MSYLELLRQSRARRGKPERENGAAQVVSERQREEAGAAAALPHSGPNHRRLEAAGYRSKVSFGRRMVWERPDTGFFVSEDVALHLLDAKGIGATSGANQRR